MYNVNELNNDFFYTPEILKKQGAEYTIIDSIYDIICLNFYPFIGCFSWNDDEYVEYII